MTVALVLFALAALGGLVMAIIRLSGKPNPPFALAVVHGLAAAAGLVTLVLGVASLTAVPKGAGVALALLLIAALGGFALFFQHLKKRALPIPLMLLHAALAVAGVVSLWLSL